MRHISAEMRLTMILATAFLCGCSESERQESARWQSEARATIPQVCSNAIPGLKNIVQVNFVAQPPHVPGAWDIEVAADYINKAGGVERTNLSLTGILVGEHAEATVDIIKIQKRQKEKRDAEVAVAK